MFEKAVTVLAASQSQLISRKMNKLQEEVLETTMEEV